MTRRLYCIPCDGTPTHFEVYEDGMGMSDALMKAHMKGRHGMERCESCRIWTAKIFSDLCWICLRERFMSR